MKKNIWLAIIGAAALTGCQSEVMQQREYVPAPREDVGPATPSSDPYAAPPQTTEVEPVRTRQETAPAPQEYQPMNNTFTNKGVDEDAPLLDKSGGKGGKKGAKQVGKGDKGDKTAGSGEYIVQKGDTPEKIARKHRVRLKDLMAANNLDEESAKKLRIGQKLVIPARSARSGKRGAGGAQTAGPGEYIVKSGDSPERIARKHHVRLKDLMAANDLDEESAKKLRIGQKLVIPGKGGATGGETGKGGERRRGAAAPRRSGGESAPRQTRLTRTPVDGGYAVEVPRDMTVAEFAKLAGVTEEQLREQNPDMPEERLRKDSIYIIPKD